MNSFHRGLLTVVFVCITITSHAVVHFVDVNSTNATPPFTNWSTAATNIQDAVDVAAPGSLVLVSNGVYGTGGRAMSGTMTNRVAVDKPITVQGVNGPQFTVIRGHQLPGLTNGDGAVRCVYLADGATMSGFRLESGATRLSGHENYERSGGAVWAMSQSAVVTNCQIIGNSACSGGGTSGGTLVNCTLANNQAFGPGFSLDGETSCGGGAYGSSLERCILTGNSAMTGGGVARSGLRNCILTGNSATSGMSGGGGWAAGFYNCTLVGNFAVSGGGGASECSLYNSIVYYNTAPDYPDRVSCWTENSCTTPLGGFGGGSGNITSAPLFVNLGGGNLHLQTNSPCINAGNNAHVTGSTDLDGRGRIVGAVVDMGAYEFQMPVHYVALNSTNPIPPYITWVTAATRIQDAVDVAAPGDEVLVTNGIYATGGRALGTNLLVNRVAVDKPLTLRSVNGPEFTFIRGHQVPGTTNGVGAVRGAYLTNGAVLSGFTVTNGATLDSGDSFSELGGGGIQCAFTNMFVNLPAVVTNCVISGNAAHINGGGVLAGRLLSCIIAGNASRFEGGGVWGAALSNCTLLGNQSLFGGGGGAFGSTLSHSLVISNSAQRSAGALLCSLFDSTISRNSAYDGPGGVGGGSLSNCIITSNSATIAGGAGGANLTRCIVAHNSASYIGGVSSGLVNQCLVFSNSSASYVGGVFDAEVLNSVIVGNSASERAGGAENCTLFNCIVYYNSASVNTNISGDVAWFCCTSPLPAYAPGSFTNEPRFIDLAAADLRLQPNSPCINAGGPVRYWTVTNTTDFAGSVRIVGGAIDVGAYEFQTPSSQLSYAWLQQSGLATDGSADFLDTDADGHNNWQEWNADTIPIDAASVLRVTAISNTGPGLELSWPCVATRTYFVERATNVSALSGFVEFSGWRFTTGFEGTMSFTDTTATNGGPYFYRVGVQP